MEHQHNSLSDSKLHMSNMIAEKSGGPDVYALTGEKSQLARSILRLPQLRRSAMAKEITKLDKMKERSEQRMNKVANTFLCGQTIKACQWQHADVQWAANTATKMPCYRNNSYRHLEVYREMQNRKSQKSKLRELDKVKDQGEKLGDNRRNSTNILYRSTDYSVFGDRTFYRLMHGGNLAKPPPIAGLTSGPRLEFRNLAGQTCFNKVTHTTTEDVVNHYTYCLNNRNKLLSRCTMTR